MKIRTRLTLQFILTMAGILSVFSLTILLFTSLTPNSDNIEASIQAQARQIATALSSHPRGWEAVSQPELDALVLPDFAVQVQDRDGKALASSARWKAWSLSTSGQTSSGMMGAREVDLYRHTVVVGSHIRGYILVAHLATVPAPRPLDVFLLAAALVNIMVGGLLVWLLVRRATRPLEHLEARASQIAAASDHSLRLRSEGPPDEITRLGHTINSMLDSLEEAYRQVQAVNTLQRHFLADISHELRTPLTILLSSLDLLKKEAGSDPAFQEAALDNIQLEVERMARMVTRLLILARTDSSAAVAREPLLVVDIVDEVCRTARSAEQKRNLSCRNLELLEDAVVLGNADYLKQLFLILLENAFKYTPARGEVEVSGAWHGGTVAITVADTGIGIAESDLARVFERFYRADNARFRSGMGLGLPIARSIAEQHGGTITAESTLGQGSRFTVLLPRLIGKEWNHAAWKDDLINAP